MSAQSLPVPLRNHVTAVDRLLQFNVSASEIAEYLSLTEADVEAIRLALVNKSAMVRAQLARGPKSSRQVANATGIPIRTASALLSELRRKGAVVVCGTTAHDARRSPDPLYTLTKNGRERMKKLGEVA